MEEAQRSKSWGQRVQLIEDLQEEVRTATAQQALGPHIPSSASGVLQAFVPQVQRTRERVRLALAGTADRPLSSQADANSTELAVEDVRSTEPAPELVCLG